MSGMEPVAIVLSSLKSAIDIAKALRSADVSIERAELKLKLADLMEALADAKLELTEVEAELAYKSDEIKRLTEALETRGDVVRFLDAVYMKGLKRAGNRHAILFGMLVGQAPSPPTS